MLNRLYESCIPASLGRVRAVRGTLFCALVWGFGSGWGQAQQLSLHQAIQQALTGPQAQALAAGVDEAKGGVRQAGLGPNPRLYLSSEDWQPWTGSYDFPNQSEDFGYLDQTFEVAGKRGKRVELATAQLRQAESTADAMRLAIAGRVAGAYWNAAVTGRIAGLLRQDMTAVEGIVRYNKERVDAGATRGVDLLRIEIERDRLRLALLAAERDAEAARLELFREMGRPPASDVQLTDSIDAPGSIAPVPAEVALARRADLLAAGDAVSAAAANVKLQRAQAAPDLDLLGGYKRNSGANTGYGGLQINLPVRNRNQGEILRAEAALRLAQARLATLDVQARAEVAESEAAYRREGDIVGNLLPDMRAKARQNLDLMTEAYQIGGVDLLRYLDAERTAFEVEVSALRTLAEYQQAALRLQLSYGVQP